MRIYHHAEVYNCSIPNSIIYLLLSALCRGKGCSSLRLSSLYINVKRKSLSNHAQKGGTALAIGAIPPDLKLLPCNWNRSWLQGVTGNLTLAELGRTPCGLQAVLLAPVLQKPLICKRFRAISVELTSNLTRKCTINLVC